MPTPIVGLIYHFVLFLPILQVLPTHYKYYEDDLQANLTSDVNPFPLHSPWVDRDIKVGEIDEGVSCCLLLLILILCVGCFPYFEGVMSYCLLHQYSIDLTETQDSPRSKREAERQIGRGLMLTVEQL